MEKVAENGRKVKAMALVFGRFSTFFQKWKKWVKMDGKLRPKKGRKFEKRSKICQKVRLLFSKMEEVDEKLIKAIL
jgi:hypothetical protein